MPPISYARHRFPPVIIQHAVWLYVRFTLSYRDIEDLLAERGARGLLRDRPALGAEVRAGDRPSPPAGPREAHGALAPRQEGGAHRWQADVSVAGGGQRGRG